MPQFKNASAKANRMMEHIYVEERMRGLSKQEASIRAIGRMKKSFKKKGGKWVKK